jgi:hypothetical protein
LALLGAEFLHGIPSIVLPRDSYSSKLTSHAGGIFFQFHPDASGWVEKGFLRLLQVISLLKKQRLLVLFGFAESPGFKPLHF